MLSEIWTGNANHHYDLRWSWKNSSLLFLEDAFNLCNSTTQAYPVHMKLDVTNFILIPKLLHSDQFSLLAFRFNLENITGWSKKICRILTSSFPSMTSLSNMTSSYDVTLWRHVMLYFKLVNHVSYSSISNWPLTANYSTLLQFSFSTFLTSSHWSLYDPQAFADPFRTPKTAVHCMWAHTETEVYIFSKLDIKY